MIAGTLLAAMVSAAAPTLQPPELTALEQHVAARPTDVRRRQVLADAYMAAGRPLDALRQLRRTAQLAPRAPDVWYALGQAYNEVKQEALETFNSADDEPWRQLLAADALLSARRFTDAFVLFQASLERLPLMVTIHDSLARIYERTGHARWAAIERTKAAPAACGERTALCEFRAGRHRAALEASLAASDAESRYWRARSANELALAAFAHIEPLPDSVERRAVRAATAQAEERYTDAVAELKAALRLAPRNPELLLELASAEYAARDFEAALATVLPLLQTRGDDPRLLSLQAHSLLQLRRPEEATAILERLVARHPPDRRDTLALGRAYLESGDVDGAIPLLEAQIAGDTDGSLHVQLARAYTASGQSQKAAPLLIRAQELQRMDDERRASRARRAITAPK